MNIKIDARVCSYSGTSVRVLAILNTETGVVAVGSLLPFNASALGDAHTVIVTDAPSRVQKWQLAYEEVKHLKDAIAAYQELKNNQLILFKDLSFDPQHVIQTRKIDVKGKLLELDTEQLNNAHVSVLLMCWAAKKSLMGHRLASIFDDDTDLEEAEDYTIPFLM